MCCNAKGDYSIRMLLWGLKAKKGQHSLWLSTAFKHKINPDVLSTDLLPMQQISSCSSLSYMLKHFLSSNASVWLHEKSNLNWPCNYLFRSQYLWRYIACTCFTFNDCYLLVLLTNQDMDSNKIFILILLLWILRMKSLFCLVLPLSILQSLSRCKFPPAFIKYSQRNIWLSA